MDLVAGVRKEGSRGGRGDFKWTDVKDSAHRENYLGHSVMAPVGRWQQGRDLHWYTRGEEDPEEKARRDREERQQVKAAEEEAMARALGLPPPSQSNANLTPLGEKEAGGVVRVSAASPEEGVVKERDSRDSRRRRRDRTRSPRRDRERDRGDGDRERRHHRHRDERHRSHRSNRHRSRSKSYDRDRSRDRVRYKRRSRSRSTGRTRARRDRDDRSRRDDSLRIHN